MSRLQRQVGKTSNSTAYIGTAGWNSAGLSGEGSHLEIYSQHFNAAEINSSFYKNHQRSTYERWRESVPAEFRFSVKLFKQFTHVDRLDTSKKELRGTIQSIAGLREKWGALLIQTPPSLAFDRKCATRFVKQLKTCTQVACFMEPRHESWFGSEALDVLESLGIELAFADPSPVATKSLKSGSHYLRLHGSPRIYYSSYSKRFLSEIAARIQAQAGERKTWCIFDNTTLGHALKNAQTLQKLLS